MKLNIIKVIKKLFKYLNFLEQEKIKAMIYRS